MRRKQSLRKALAVKTIVFITTCLLLQACSGDSADTPFNTSTETTAESSTQPVVVAPDIDVLPGEISMGTTLLLTDVDWKLNSIVFDDGTSNSISDETLYIFRFDIFEAPEPFGRYSGFINCHRIEGVYLLDNDILSLTLPILDVVPCPDFVDLELTQGTITERAFGGRPLMVNVSENELTLILESNEQLHFLNSEISVEE